MNYFVEMFGDFIADEAEDAALKFCLCVMAVDNRVEDLFELISNDTHVDGVEGEPGWMLERRNEKNTIAYKEWPKSADYKAYVDQDMFYLAHPECYIGRNAFFSYLSVLCKSYKPETENQKNTIKRIEVLLKKSM